ncbi:hypothetical protein QJS10_CPB11g02189 [Acorus calamus]|uniref:Aspartate/glutamate/uridylate kinase domain-containing protein n=1 Tax=Acorus calamus TaxID=4465 RepID=A0AAV9DS38_ACOCL|nr:hypothetical protein QJS10_CPB11g02189 [Acorus calamus]
MRFPSATKFQLKLKRRVLTAFASEANSPNGETIKAKTDNSATGASDGPPLLTILAGVVVLLLVCWVIGSIIMWLVELKILVGDGGDDGWPWVKRWRLGRRTARASGKKKGEERERQDSRYTEAHRKVELEECLSFPHREEEGRGSGSTLFASAADSYKILFKHLIYSIYDALFLPDDCLDRSVEEPGLPGGGMWSVHKFGGTCMGTAKRIQNVADIILNDASEKKLAVVSAMSQVTDIMYNLIDKAQSRDRFL